MQPSVAHSSFSAGPAIIKGSEKKPFFLYFAAGTSAPLNLRFEPKLDEDIEFELPLLTQTGPMSVPVRALCKKVLP